MRKIRNVCLATLVAVLVAGVTAPAATAPLSDAAMALTIGGSALFSFLAGVGCGLALIGTVAAVVSPDPATKLLIGSGVSTLISCGSLFF